MKEAIVTPILKKNGLDSLDLKNYRPVSNLGFLSKVLERVVLRRLDAHIKLNCLEDNLQSAYKKNHCTETALLKIANDLSCSLDNNKGILLVCLDLSAAFDTLQHQTLIDILATSYGIRGTALEWFRTYLTNRTQKILVDGQLSSQIVSTYGVPQGSVLGPILFSMYTRAINHLADTYDITLHKYADDIQLYTEYDPADYNSARHAVERMQNCIICFKSWMSQHNLRLNPEKTELVNLLSPIQLKRYGTLSLSIDGVVIKPVKHVKILGVMLDMHLTMDSQVTEISRCCNFHLRNIGKIRRYLTTEACKNAVQCLVMSKIDYCSTLLSNTTQSNLSRLQRIQNRAARLITQSSITAALNQLHWLPCNFRIHFRLAVFVFKCLTSAAPVYLQGLVRRYVPPRRLRSADDQSKLVVIPCNKTVGSKAFSVAAPSHWNVLSIQVRSIPSMPLFKKALKTELYRLFWH